MRALTFALGLVLTSAQVVESQSALRPDTVFAIPGGPRILLKQAPSGQVVSLRIFVPLEEGSAEAGFAHVLQLVRLEELRPLARRVGARLEGTRSRVGISYTASGTREDFDYLAWLLRQAVGRPTLARGAVERARLTAQAQVDRSLETAEGVLTARLRERVWPSRPALTGTRASLTRVSRGTLEEFWARTHQADSMLLVAVGPLEPVMIMASFQGLGAPGEDRDPPLEAPTPTEPIESGIQVLRSWFGQAYVVADGADPRPAVAAVLLADRLRARANGSFEASVELWEAGSVSAIIVIAAAYPSRSREVRQAIRELVPTTATELTETEMAAAVGHVRADLLLGGGAPWGVAALIGHYAEETGDPRAADHLLTDLDGLDTDRMRRFLRSMEERGPIRQELTP